MGRPSLARTLNSIRVQDYGEPYEILLALDGPCKIDPHWLQNLPVRIIQLDRRHFDFGDTARNVAMRHVKTSHMMYLDDDDWHTPGALKAVYAHAYKYPTVPLVFRMLWWKSAFYVGWDGNGADGVVPACLVHPHLPQRYAFWPGYNTGERDFWRETLTHYPPDSVKYSKEVIAIFRQDQKSFDP